MTIRPLQLMVVGFVDPALDGSVLGALEDASATGAIKVVDVLGVYEGEDGTVVAAQATNLSENAGITSGAWVGALIGLGAGGAEGAEAEAVAGAIHAMDEHEYGNDADGLATIADDIPAEGAGMLLAIEHTWAILLRDALRESGGIMVAQDFLSPETLIAIGAIAAQPGKGQACHVRQELSAALREELHAEPPRGRSGEPSPAVASRPSCTAAGRVNRGRASSSSSRRTRRR